MISHTSAGHYRHAQRGTVILLSCLGLALVFSGTAITHPQLIQLWVGPVILLICATLFGSLTIEITEHELIWKFGPGLIRKKVALSEIVSATPVKTRFIEGWGIHLSRFGWLYNVSGFDAVALTLRDGKRFALGTDEPKKLADHLAEAIRLHQTPAKI